MDDAVVRDSGQTKNHQMGGGGTLSAMRDFSDVRLTRWFEVRFVSRNLLELTLVHL